MNPQSEIKNQKLKSGVWEWADAKANCQVGCVNNCKYCYAKSMAVQYKRCNPEEWTLERFTPQAYDTIKEARRKNMIMMFPTAHDLSVVNLMKHKDMIAYILRRNWNLLLVTKARLEVIQNISRNFAEHRDRIMFRITIGSANDNVLKFWEPGAPCFTERLRCLEYLKNSFFKTSLSIEPMLDNNPYRVIELCSSYVTENIWLGLPRKLKQRIALNDENNIQTSEAAGCLLAMQPDYWVIELYHKLKDNPKIRFKDSIIEVLKRNEIEINN
jgi:DNA repair photolyase